MMKLAIISFTQRGCRWNHLLGERLQAAGHDSQGYTLEKFLSGSSDYETLLPVKEPIHQWVERQFRLVDGFIFISATGIAVRLIAPHIGHKSTDPAVVVMDDTGQFIISLLSGHVGGANALTAWLASEVRAVPVITTATDLADQFAVDLFAVRNQLQITDWTMVKQISADILAGIPVGFYSDQPIYGELPAGLLWQQSGCNNIVVTYQQKEACEFMKGSVGTVTYEYLRLVPKVIILGIGSRKGASKAVISQFIHHVLAKYQIDPASLKAIASIDLKENEEGLLDFAKDLQLSCEMYSAAELALVEGDFTESAFVRNITGVGNVCERAALCCARKYGKASRLVIAKQSGDGVTVAAAMVTQTIDLTT